MTADRTPPDGAGEPAPEPGAEPPPGVVTAMLRKAAAGDREVLDGLFHHLYGELKRVAQRVRAGRASETLSTTAVVHEAYLKLVPSDVDWASRAHFFGVAARAMRQILVDAARARGRAKRGGREDQVVTFDEGVHPAPVPAGELLDLDAALTRLSALDERQARIVEHRYFGGLTAAETAEVLGLSEATVNRDWRLARAWLRRELGGGATGAADGA